MSKVFKVVPATPGANPQEISLKAALEKARKTGVLMVPQASMCLTISSGVQVEVLRDGK